MLDGDPCSILENEFVKPGKGQAFNRVKLRNLKSGRVWERTFKSGDTLEGADVMDVDLEYSYTDGEFWHFMDPSTYEQYGADRDAVGESEKWLKEQERYEITLYNGTPLAVTPPNFIELEITMAAPNEHFSGCNLSQRLQFLIAQFHPISMGPTLIANDNPLTINHRSIWQRPGA